MVALGTAAYSIMPWTAIKSFADEDAFPVVETVCGKLRGMNVSGKGDANIMDIEANT